MISVQKIIRLVRLKEKDNDETKYSDYVIIQSLNEALDYINLRFSTLNADFLERKVLLDEKDINAEIDTANAALPEGSTPQPHVSFLVTGVDLPDDYLSLMYVLRARDDYRLKCVSPRIHLKHDEYYITKGKLFTRCHTVQLHYRGSVAEVKYDTDTIDLPVSFMNGLAKMTSMILNNDAATDVMREAMDKVVDSLIPHRRYSNMKISRPFHV